MYGLVNKALEDMITSRFDEKTWDAIRSRAGVDIDVFISNEGYPDELTYGLVAAAAEVLQLPAAEVLEAFGVHWMTKTAKEGYGELIDATGQNIRDFLLNLPAFHTRIALLLPHLKPPEFRCSSVTEDSLDLHYYSRRKGLAPFVMGILKGMGIVFQSPVRIEHISAGEPGDGHEVFHISWKA